MIRRILAAASVFFLSASPAIAQSVNVLTSRQPDLIAPLLEAFTAETGIEVNSLFLKKGMSERLKAEGRNSPVDVVMTTDIGNLIAVVNAGATQAADTSGAIAEIPAQFRDPAGQWFGLTARARLVYASKDRVSEDSFTYEQLAGPAFEGRLCTRSGQHPYNIALFASLIAHHGEAKAQDILAGLKANMARTPQGNDRAQAKGVFSGECDVALGNSYYLGLMATNEKEPEQQDWFGALKVIFPNSDGRGTHMNISGMAMAKHAPNRGNAQRLMDFLASPEAQQLYAELVYEYPVNAAVPASDLVSSFGTFKRDTLDLATIADLRDEASRLVDIVGYDN